VKGHLLKSFLAHISRSRSGNRGGILPVDALDHGLCNGVVKSGGQLVHFARTKWNKVSGDHPN